MMFHSPDYIEFMSKYFYLSDEKKKNPDCTPPTHLVGIGMSTDIPAFPHFFQFSQLVSGSSLLAAQIIEEGQADIVINWLGGFHHAKRFKASGFCYCNDIVLGIQHLLRSFNRILYVDIDVHHGDGVEEAFLTTNRVFTLSFHQYDEKEKFFPGTGDVKDIGEGDGKFYAMNVPLRPGCDNNSYHSIFGKICDKVVDTYRPDVIWLQCGADSLHGDLIGSFNVSTKGHGDAVRHMLRYNLPIVLVGGGGYTVENVARCWAYETSICLGREIANELPKNLEFAESYKDEPILHFKAGSKATTNNQNDEAYLNALLEKVMENLRQIESAPNIGMGEQVPTDYEINDQKFWQESKKDHNTVMDSFVFKEKGVSHLLDSHHKK
jgi:histone deacetylase 1/2